MKQAFSLRAVCAVAAILAGLVASASAQFTLSMGVGPFTPSFRGEANTTWFGWAGGTFDGSPDNELIDNPLATLGTTPFGYSLTQIGTDDILSGSNNIYTSTLPLVTLQLAIPIAIAPGGLFTTIILQGNTAFGGFGVTPEFHDIGGVSPTVVVGNNYLGSGQFWAKYEIPSGAISQTTLIDLGGFTSIANLTVDTYHSTTAYATDTAQAVPEPSALVFIAGGIGILVLRRRRGALLPAR